MAYTPPSGNAVAFLDVGAPYTPPSGNAVDFLDGGTGRATIVFSAASSGTHGVSGSGVAAIVLSTTGSGTVVPVGRTSYMDLVFVGSGTGSTIVSGIGDSSLEFVGGGTGQHFPVGIGMGTYPSRRKDLEQQAWMVSEQAP